MLLFNMHRGINTTKSQECIVNKDHNAFVSRGPVYCDSKMRRTHTPQLYGSGVALASN
jgi:hypothetical protein